MRLIKTFSIFDQKDHGGPNSEDRHVGDLGNIAADPEGNSVVFIADTQVKLTGDAEYSVAGRSIVIHENADDLGKDTKIPSTTNSWGGGLTKLKGFLWAEVHLLIQGGPDQFNHAFLEFTHFFSVKNGRLTLPC